MISLKGKKVFITGATSGIGKSCAYKFAEAGADLILSARRESRLKEICFDLKDKYKVNADFIELDVRNYDDVRKSVDNLPDENKNISVLINNAGLARGLSKLDEGSVKDWDEMIDTNVKGLLFVSKCIIPLMLKNNCGHIINIGSIAGREVYPMGNVYCATKHAVDAITKSMRMELVDTNIRVTTIDPGLVETEFSIVRYRGNAEKAKSAYAGLNPLTPDNVAETVLFASTRDDNFVIAEMVLLPKAQASVMVIDRKKE